MWRKEGKHWKITHHHSSVVPGAAASAPAASGSDDPKTKLLQASCQKSAYSRSLLPLKWVSFDTCLVCAGEKG